MGEAKRRKQQDPNYGKPIGDPKYVDLIEAIINEIQTKLIWIENINGEDQIMWRYTKIYPFLEDNVTYFNDQFISVFQEWINHQLFKIKHTEEKLKIIGQLTLLGEVFSKFSLGESPKNLPLKYLPNTIEIAIVAYENADKIFQSLSSLDYDIINQLNKPEIFNFIKKRLFRISITFITFIF